MWGAIETRIFVWLYFCTQRILPVEVLGLVDDEHDSRMLFIDISY